jgi:pimeloyl-ACP methyl ester carboxylesterase
LWVQKTPGCLREAMMPDDSRSGAASSRPTTNGRVVGAASCAPSVVQALTATPAPTAMQALTATPALTAMRAPGAAIALCLIMPAWYAGRPGRANAIVRSSPVFARDRHEAIPMLVRMAGELVDLGRYKVYVKRRGLGPPLLLVHGIYPGASHEEWARAIAPLAQRHTVYALDLLGFGESDAPPRLTYTTRLFHHLLRDLVHIRIGQPVALIAAGLAGAAATQLAVFDDEIVSRLVLVCPVDQPHEVTLIDRLAHFLYGTLPFGAGQYDAAIVPEALHAFVNERYADPSHASPERFAQIRYNAARPHSAGPYISYLTGYLDLDVFRPLRNVRRPVQVIWGEMLGEPPRGRILAPAAWSQGKRIDIIPRAKHWPHEEQSAAFAETVGAFLSESGD